MRKNRPAHCFATSMIAAVSVVFSALANAGLIALPSSIVSSPVATLSEPNTGVFLSGLKNNDVSYADTIADTFVSKDESGLSGPEPSNAIALVNESIDLRSQVRSVSPDFLLSGGPVEMGDPTLFDLAQFNLITSVPGYHLDDISADPDAPEYTSLILLGFGLAGLGFCRRKKA